MGDVIKHFLLVFNRATGMLVREEPFEYDIEAALAAYADCEEAYKDSTEIQILLVGSDSIETVRETHSNYFNSHEFASKYFAGL